MHSHILQQPTLYDTKSEKTIVIIMRDFKIIPPLMDILHKDRVKPVKRDKQVDGRYDCMELKTIFTFYHE